VRGEWLEARDAQQQSMQWTFAAIAVILAGIFSKDLRNTDPFVYVFATAIVGFASSMSQAIWFGEALRMERAALYLRGREHELKLWLKSSSGEPQPQPSPLAWETFRGAKPQDEAAPWVPKSKVSIMAAVSLYGIMWLAGTGLLAETTLFHASKLGGSEHALAYVLLGGSLASYVVITVYVLVVGRRVFLSSSEGAKLEAIVWPPE
jgi:hypothetical protein